MDRSKLQLIYVKKIGYDSKGYGLYEFLFSQDTSTINTQELGWEEMPASQNAEPPEQSSIDLILSLKTKKIDFKCLHELDDRAYIDGYYTKHCLAYEDTDEDKNHDPLYEEVQLIVFHFGMKEQEVRDFLLSRDIMLKEEIMESKQVEKEVFHEEEDEEDDD